MILVCFSVSLLRSHLRDVPPQMFNVWVCIFRCGVHVRAKKIFTTFQFSQNQNIALRSYSLSSRLRVCVCVLALLYILFTICVIVCRFTISISIPRRFVFLFLFWNIRSKWLHWRATHVQFDVIYHINKTSAHHYHRARAHFAAITIITMI